MKLTAEQLKIAENKLQAYLPFSQTVYGTLMLMNRVCADPIQVFVDKWPDFSVIISKPTREQESDSIEDIQFFGKDDTSLETIMRNCTAFDWTQFMIISTSYENRELFKEVASKKQTVWRGRSVCHLMILKDPSCLPEINCAEISLGSLNESHVALINQTWKFGQKETVRMIRNMVKNFPSCCVLDAEGRPVSWILTYASCSMGILYTLPEHRGKGYAKAVVSTMAKKLFSEGYPVYCTIEEENAASFQLFKSLGFTEVPSYRQTWFDVTPVTN